MKMRSFSLSLMAGAVLAATALVAPKDARAGCSADGGGYLGEVCVVAFNFCPRGTVQAAGQLMPISTNTALFSLLGTKFGGDGKTSFGIPDLRGRAPMGVGQGPGLSNVTWGQYRGDDTQELSVSQLPTHTHAAVVTASGGAPALSVSNASPNQPAPAANTYISAKPITNQGGQVMLFTTDGTNKTAISGVSGGTSGITVTNANAGGSASFGIAGPRLGLMHCIVTVGLYPSRQ